MWINADELGHREDEVPIATPDGPGLKCLYIILGEAPDGLYFWCDPTGNSIMGWAEREEACRKCDELNSPTMHAAIYERTDIVSADDSGAVELQTLH